MSTMPIDASAALALIADLYHQLTDAQQMLAAERQSHAVTRGDLDRLRATVLTDATGPEDPPPA